MPGPAGANSQNGLFLSSPDGGFLHRGCVLPYQHGGGRGSVGAALPHCEKGKAKGRRKVACQLRPYERSRCAEHVGVSVSSECARHTGGSHGRTTGQRAGRTKFAGETNEKARPRTV